MTDITLKPPEKKPDPYTQTNWSDQFTLEAGTHSKTYKFTVTVPPGRRYKLDAKVITTDVTDL